MKFLILPVFLLTLLFISCKPKNGEDANSEVKVEIKDNEPIVLSPDLQNYENEIMEYHDAAMEKMGELHKLSKQLEDIKSKMPAESAHVSEIDALIMKLKKADEDMMNWMKVFSDTKSKFGTLTEEQKLGFYQKEHQKITYVSSAIFESIIDANKWLEAHPAG